MRLMPPPALKALRPQWPLRVPEEPDFKWFFGGRVFGRKKCNQGRIWVTSFESFVSIADYTVAIMGVFYPKLTKPSIKTRPNEQIPLGSNISIACQGAEDLETLTFFLLKSGSLIASRTEISKKKTTEFLLSGVRLEDAGIYTCKYRKADPHLWSQASDPVELVVTDPKLTKPSIKTRPNEQIPLGSNITLECQGAEDLESLTFFLLKSGSLIASRTEISKKNTTEFLLSGVRLEDAGIYTCKYRKADPHLWSQASDPVELVVTDPKLTKPSIKTRPNEQIPLGSNITLECQGAEDLESLTFFLLKSGSLIASRTEISKKNTTEFLLSGVRLEDAGIYTCKYRKADPHLWSQASDPVELVVTDPKLTKPSIKTRPNEQIPLGSNITLECQGAEDLESLTFFLLKSGSLIASRTEISKKNTTEFLLSGVRLEDAGIYTCKYRKADPHLWSQASDPVELVVTDPKLTKPSIKTRPNEQIPLGSNITLECQGAEDLESLTFFLLKSGSLIASRTEISKKNTTEFLLSGVRLEDAGIYTCKYRKANPHLWSQASDPVELVVTAPRT
ncbi:immunoglobulin superfamily member 1-like [Elgaria multicarinata webbii]|uniref:immunoglobulin superfamily member 1-like n=1 Tax=Elgaria multicarinata webbii TaxID=159646 RepID=UPI002FCD146F